MKTALFIFVLLLLAITSFAQESKKILTSQKTGNAAKLDSLIKIAKIYIDSSPAKTRVHAFSALQIAAKIAAYEQQAMAYLIIGISYQREQKYPEALSYYNKALELGIKNNLSSICAKAYGSIGTVYENTAEFENAISAYNNAKQIFHSQKDTSGVVRCLINTSNALSITRKNAAAIEELIHGQKLAEKIGNKYLLSRIQNNICIIYQKMGKNEEALKSFYASAEISKEIQDTNGLADSYNNIGITYQALKNYDKALEYFLLAKPIREQKNDKRGLAMIFNNIGSVYFSKEDYKKALENFIKAYNISNEINDLLGQSKYLKNISDVFVKENKYKEVIPYLEKSREIAMQIQAKDELLSALHNLAKAYAAVNDYKKAYLYSSEYFIILDSVYNEKNTRIIEEMKLKYDTEKKETELILKEQKIQILTSEKAVHFQRIIFLVILIFTLLILGVLLFFRQRKIFVKNKLIAEADKKIIEIQLQNSLLEQDKLSRELEYKKKEIISFALQIVGKNEFLETIKDDIKDASATLKGEENALVLKKLVSQINRNLVIDRDRSEFQKQIDTLNQDFFDKLIKICPAITENEKRLSALLRLNFTSKDIAAIVNISPASVDMGRHRLRKKLNLSVEENLVHFLNSL